ncbi:hydroxymethylpyrimidine/phosphomethylpyrimidine kinase, partial [Rhodoferax antarcticus]|nr:hydroxymethylpyrimidine/phosphomethylpyrimidine kinase [Rhodoferax antarcticus]
HLALGLTLAEAVQQARSFVRSALLAGASVKTGQGSGPLNHGFAPVVMRVKPCLERMSLLGAM